MFQNVAPNHRANDVIVLEDRLQVLPARFMYGPLDMVCLSGERVSHVVMVICVLLTNNYLVCTTWVFSDITILAVEFCRFADILFYDRGRLPT